MAVHDVEKVSLFSSAGKPVRYEQLDSLRGVAALAVVIGHIYIAYNDNVGTAVYRSPLSPYLTGPFSVVLFFVLSGFVLSVPQLGGKTLSYRAYAVRRVCRLWVPFAFAVLVSLLLWMALGAKAADIPSHVVSQSWGIPMTTADLVKHFFMVGWPSTAFQLDPPTWSLIIEMRASLLFPLLFCFGTKAGRVAVVVAAFMTITAVAIKSKLLNDPSAVSAESAIGSMVLTLRYIGFFIFGIACAAYIKALKRVMRRIPIVGHLVVVCIFIVGMVVLAHGNHINTMLNDVYYGAFAAYFISLCVASRRLADFLRSGPFPWLGNVSFSLYLIHWPIICATIIVLLDRITLPAALFVSFPLTLLAAAFMERWVERPSHELGKRLSAKIERVRRRSDQSATIEA